MWPLSKSFLSCGKNVLLTSSTEVKTLQRNVYWHQKSKTGISYVAFSKTLQKLIILLLFFSKERSSFKIARILLLQKETTDSLQTIKKGRRSKKHGYLDEILSRDWKAMLAKKKEKENCGENYVIAKRSNDQTEKRKICLSRHILYLHSHLFCLQRNKKFLAT